MCKRHSMRAALMVLAFLFCSSKVAEGKDRIILTSFYPIYIEAINVTQGVPGVAVVDLTKPQTGCLHDYQLTPQDMKSIASAWVFVVNGGGMESFIDKAVKQRPDLTIIDASKGIELLPGSGGSGRTAVDAKEYNPHVWVSVSGAIGQVKNIRDGLAAADPSNAAAYRANADAYIGKLEDLRKKMHDGLSGISSRAIITFHEAFPYFAREFNLTIAAVIEREPGSEPSAGELAGTIRIVKDKKVKALFAEPQYPAKAGETIVRETGSVLYTLDPAVTGPLDPDAYVRIMNANLLVLQKALR